jgi:hypothetical protein
MHHLTIFVKATICTVDCAGGCRVQKGKDQSGFLLKRSCLDIELKEVQSNCLLVLKNLPMASNKSSKCPDNSPLMLSSMSFWLIFLYSSNAKK